VFQCHIFIQSYSDQSIELVTK